MPDELDIAYAQISSLQAHMVRQIQRDGRVTVTADPQGLVEAAEDLAEIISSGLVEKDPKEPFKLRLTRAMCRKFKERK